MLLRKLSSVAVKPPMSIDCLKGNMPARYYRLVEALLRDKEECEKKNRRLEMRLCAKVEGSIPIPGLETLSLALKMFRLRRQGDVAATSKTDDNTAMHTTNAAMCRPRLTLKADDEAITITKKNVLMIIVDDLRPQLNAYNVSACGEPMLTPATDRLAKRGLTFRHQFLIKGALHRVQLSISVYSTLT